MIRDEMRCKRSGRALAGERILLNYVTILAATCHDGGTDEAPSLSHCSSTRISSGDMERDWLVVDQQSGSTSLSPSMSLSPSLYLTLWNVQSYVRSVLTVMQQGDQGKIPNWSSLLSPSSFLMSDMRSSSPLFSFSLLYYHLLYFYHILQRTRTERDQILYLETANHDPRSPLANYHIVISLLTFVLLADQPKGPWLPVQWSLEVAASCPPLPWLFHAIY
jgi:hypothetical protein